MPYTPQQVRAAFAAQNDAKNGIPPKTKMPLNFASQVTTEVKANPGIIKKAPMPKYRIGRALAIAAAILLCGRSYAQPGVAVNQVSSAPPAANVKLLFYDANNNLEFMCIGASNQNTFTRFSVSGPGANALTSIAVSSTTATATTAAAHNLVVGMKVFVTGVSTSGGKPMNNTSSGYYIATVPSSTTLTFTVPSGITGATYTDSSMELYTYAPRQTDPVWAVEGFAYASATQPGTAAANALLTFIGWAGGSTAANQICANRASLFYY